VPPEGDPSPVDEPETVRKSEADRVAEWLQKQGYALEHKTAEEFRRAGFVPRLGLTYRDFDEGKVREVDVVARASLAASRVEVHLVVECKRLHKPWVVRVADMDYLRKGNLSWLPVATARVREHMVANRAAIEAAYPVPQPVGFDLIQAFKDKPNDADAAHDAMAQVVSAAVGLAADRVRFPNPAVFHPVVVVDGSLFEARFEAYPVASVTEVERARVHWSGARQLPHPVLIDVVTVDGLETFASDARWSAGQLAEALEPANYDFRDPVTTQ
jgi:hypothetical protein